MTISRILPCVLVLALTVGTGVGCKKGGGEEQTVSKTDLVQQLSVITQSYNAVQQSRQELAKLRYELAELEATPEAKRSAEQKARYQELKGEVTTRDDDNTTRYDELQTKLADFLTTALNDFPGDPETLEGLRIYSEEAMVYAEDAVSKAGDYKKAIDQLQLARSYYEQVGKPVYEPLNVRLASLEELRYITHERFDQITKGMTENQVREVAGTPYWRNVKEDPQKKVLTWLYPKREGGAAAVYFKLDTRKVYSASFDAVKVKVAEE